MARPFQWARRVGHLGRYRHIAAVLVKYGFDEVVQALRYRMRLGIRAAGRAAGGTAGRSRPQNLRLALEELGPTFIKVGQLLSTRPDLLPPEYVRELEQLQDQVAPAPLEKVRAELARQLGGPVETFFRRFDPQPLAAGSVAMVYRAQTPEGEPVAVKVLRPGIVQTLRTECEILQDLAGVVKSTLSPDDTLDPVQMAREFTEAVLREVDLTGELSNLQRFARNFTGDPTVHLARPCPALCRRGVLTMELIEGVKPSDAEALAAAGLDGKTVAKRGADFVLRQIFEFGFFHTDPHPGNFLVLPGNILAPLDFGQVARLGSQDRALLAEMVLAIVDRDARGVARAFARADMLGEQTSRRELTGDLEEMLDAYHSRPLGQIPLGQMLSNTFEVIRRHRVRPPPEFTMMLKAMMTVEALGTAVDADFRLIDSLKPFARRIRLARYSPLRAWEQVRAGIRDAADLAGRLPEDLSVILNNLKRGQLRMHVHHEHLENLTRTLDKSSNRVSFALIIAGLTISSSLLVPQTGNVLGIVSLQTLGVLGYLTAAVLGLWLLVSLMRSRDV